MLGPPRASQIPWSGSRQTLVAHSAWAWTIGQRRRGQALAVAGVHEDRVEHRSEHVVLALVKGAVADPYRARAGVAGQIVAERSVRSRRPSIPYMI